MSQKIKLIEDFDNIPKGMKFHFVVKGNVENYDYVEKCRNSNYHILKDSDNEDPKRFHISQISEYYSESDDAWEALCQKLENEIEWIRNHILHTK